MTRVVHRSAADAGADRPYHLFEDCHYLEQYDSEPRSMGLDTLWDDTECCHHCVKRAFVYKEGCVKCDGPHELEPHTLDSGMIQWRCPEGGFRDACGADIFQRKIEGAGVSKDDIRAVVNGIVADGGQDGGAE